MKAIRNAVIGECKTCNELFRRYRMRQRWCSEACRLAYRPTRDEIAAAFLPRVDRRSAEECWPWLGRRGHHGYGAFSVVAVAFKAHRVAYWLAGGVEPGDLSVCHRCDNPPCCNPRHLFLGTQADNNADMDAKGRRSRGSKHSSSKLTEAAVLEVRALLAEGLTHRAIAARFGVCHAVVGCIARGTTWSHVP